MTENINNGPITVEDKNIGYLERDFSIDNINEYATACYEVGWKIYAALESADKKKTTGILIPSRGAIPIFAGAMMTLQDLNQDHQIDLPKLGCFDYLRKRKQEKIGSDNKCYPVLLFPFTADVDVHSDFDPTMANEKVSEGMRRFGVKAFLDFLKAPDKRNSREYRLFLSFLEIVEKRRNLLDFYRQFPKVDNWIYIDTVISGRASWTMLDEMNKNGLSIGEIKSGQTIEPILIIDRKGDKYKQNIFKTDLDKWCRQPIVIPKILSEDKGAALEGVVAVNYPQLITGFLKKGFGNVLAGCWHSIPNEEASSYSRAYESFLAILDQALFLKNEKKKIELMKLESLIPDFLKILAPLLDKKESKKQRGNEINPHYRIARTLETSAHVIQVYFEPKTVENMVREIMKKVQ